MRRIVVGIAAVWFSFVAIDARADEPPADVDSCRGKAADTACRTEGGGDGHCGDGTCSRATPDGGREYSCFRCLPGAPAAPATTTKKSNCAGGLDAASVVTVAAGMLLLARRRR